MAYVKPGHQKQMISECAIKKLIEVPVHQIWMYKNRY